MRSQTFPYSRKYRYFFSIAINDAYHNLQKFKKVNRLSSTGSRNIYLLLAFQWLSHLPTVKWPDYGLKNQQTIAYCLRSFITYLLINVKSRLAFIVKPNLMVQIYLKEDKCRKRGSHKNYGLVDLLFSDIDRAVLIVTRHCQET